MLTLFYRLGWVLSISPATIILTLMGLSVVGQSHARQEFWNTESLEYVNETGAFNCSGCHTPNAVNANLKVVPPASVPFNATSAKVALAGFNSSGGKTFFRYKTTGTARQITDVRNEAERNDTDNNNDDKEVDITFSSSVNPVELRYCMLDTAGATGASGRLWHCDNFTINRDPPPNELPTIDSLIPADQMLDVNGENYSFTVTVSDDKPSPVVKVTSSSIGIASVAFNGSGSYTVNPIAEGISNIKIQVTDSDGESVSQSFRVEVSEPTQIPPIIVIPPFIPPVVVIPPVIVLPPIEPTINIAPIVALLDVSGSVSLDIGDIFSVSVSIDDDAVEVLSFRVESSNDAVATGNYQAEGVLTIDAVGPGVASIKLIVSDASLPDTSISLNVSVKQVNNAPTAKPDSFPVAEAGVKILLDVLTNDTDLENDPLAIDLDTFVTSQGNTIAVRDLTIVYVASTVLTSNDSFSYRARDSKGALSELAVVTLTPSDFDSDGTIDALDNCPLLPNIDQSNMDDDLFGDLCDEDPDGDGQPGISGQLFESGRELVQLRCLTCHLNGLDGAPLIGDDDIWNARIAEAGGSPEDLLPSVLNGKGAMPAFAAEYSTLELIQAIRFMTGREEIGPEEPVQAFTDLDLDNVDDALDNCDKVPNPNQLDSDSNGVGDLCEPLADRDGDGYPFKLDDDDGNAQRLPASSSNSNTSVFSSDSALSLGRVAQAAAAATGFDSAAVVLSEALFSQQAATVFPGVNVGAAAGYSSLMGISNVIVKANGGNAELIIQVSTNLPLDPVLRIFDTSSGLWRDFESGSPNALASAPIASAGCPLATSANYQAGLSAGNPCVKITINDGGLNDADGSTNGEVELIANIARKLRLGDGSNTPDVVVLNPSKSGGSVSASLLAILLLWACILRSTRRHLREQL